MVTSGVIWHTLRDWFKLPVNIRDVCVMLAPAFSGLTAIATYYFTAELKDSNAGLLAAIFMGIAPGYISRSWPALAITKAIAIAHSWPVLLDQSAESGFSLLRYMDCVVLLRGFCVRWIRFHHQFDSMHIFVLILMSRYSHKLYLTPPGTHWEHWHQCKYLSWVFLPIRSNHMAASGVWFIVRD